MPVDPKQAPGHELPPALGGDVSRVAGYQARFRGVLFPGETIVTSLWEEGDRIVIEASCAERGTPVVSNAAITLRSWQRAPGAREERTWAGRCT